MYGFSQTSPKNHFVHDTLAMLVRHSKILEQTQIVNFHGACIVDAAVGKKACLGLT